MASFTVDAGNGQTFKITQGVGDLKAGYRLGGAYSRISAYLGPNLGVHTGSNSPTLARNGKPFG